MTDIEIAQKNKMIPVAEVAAKIGIPADQLENYGPYKAKITFEELSALQEKADSKPGKLILVTAVTPTPAGEGKSTVSIGLADGLNKIGKKTVVALREPSLGPCFGVKAGHVAVVTLRLFLWKISTFILLVISMPSQLPTI